MRKYNLAVRALDITVVQLSVWNPETSKLEVRRFDDDGEV